MIVICTKCQARFRVADGKIGPRGAKVRCSRCQTVFVVHPDLGTMALASSAPAAPIPTPVPAFRPIVDDPFAAVPAATAFAPAAARGADPFAPARGDDPFAPAAPASGGDPFAPPPPAPADGARATLPVTDLSDLLGSTPAARSLAPARLAPPPLPVPPPLPPIAREGTHGDGPTELGSLPEYEDGGLALEDRLTPPPTRVAPSPLAADPPLDLALGPMGSAHDPPAAAGDPLGGGVPLEPAPEPPPPWAVTGRPAAEARATPPLAAPAPPQAERIPGHRGSRLRALAVNAVSLLVMIGVAIAFLLVWRTDRPLEAGSFRPAALVGALRRDPGGAGPFVARDVRSGLYERARAAPLLFVRGQVVSRAPDAVAAVTVTVEVVRGEQVLARGDAVAGAVPTPEELHHAVDAAALARAARAAAARAPRAVRPGDAVPFLVAIGDAPAELEGAALRVAIAPARRGGP